MRSLLLTYVCTALCRATAAHKLAEFEVESVSLLQSGSPSVRRGISSFSAPREVLGAEDFVKARLTCPQNSEWATDYADFNSFSIPGRSERRAEEKASCLMRLVVARYKEDLSWLKELHPEIGVVVYNKDNNLTKQNSHYRGACPEEISNQRKCDWIELPNIPTESHTYLFHISEYYNKGFCDMEAFSQGTPSFHGGSPCLLNDLYDDLAKGARIGYRHWSRQDYGLAGKRVSQAESSSSVMDATAYTAYYRSTGAWPSYCTAGSSKGVFCVPNQGRHAESNPRHVLELMTARSWKFLSSEHTYLALTGFFAASAQSLSAWPEDAYRVGLELFNTERNSATVICEMGYAYEMIWTALFAKPYESRATSSSPASQEVMIERTNLLSYNLSGAVTHFRGLFHSCETPLQSLVRSMSKKKADLVTKLR